MITAALVLVSLAGLLFLFRLVVGPSLPDRILALDGLLGCIAVGIVVDAVRTGTGVAVDAVLVVTLTAFVGTAVAARFVERRGG